MAFHSLLLRKGIILILGSNHLTCSQNEISSLDREMFINSFHSYYKVIEALTF